ncbi:MAG: hypothetical protein J6A77_03740 [Lachnospiraceae bacterium]|nr:hypothetical protein [Lachnospiraceae bacterium]
MRKNKRILVKHLSSLGILLVGFLECRYAVFGVIHGMKDWPVVLAGLGAVVLLLSVLTKKVYLPWFVSIGYSVGFLAGTLFHAEGLDSGGGKTDNLWMIWTVVFLVCILAGVVLESVMKWRKLLKSKITK